MNLQKIFAEKGLQAFRRLVIAQQLPVMFERSLRLQAGIVESRRLLFTVPIAAISNSGFPDKTSSGQASASDSVNSAVAEVLQICRAMSSPQRLLDSIKTYFHGAEFVHFGFECSGKDLIGKCYLELPTTKAESHSTNHRLIFLGFKWSMLNDDLSVVSRYSSQEISQWNKVHQAMLMKFQKTNLFETASKLLSEFAPASVDSGVDHLRLLRVSEEGSGRLSHDLNVYSVERTIAEVAHCLSKMNREFGGDVSTLDQWLQTNRLETIGHLSMGCGRHDHPFVTVYHSADINQLSSL